VTFMEGDNNNSEFDWITQWSNLVSGQPLYTLAAGVVCGMLANVILRGRTGNNVARPLMNFASAATHGPCKMVLVVRTDVGMGKGKAAAQCAHAAVMCYKKALREAPEMVDRWEGMGVTKVCVKVDSEEQLLNLATHAREAGVVFGVVRDAGRTQIASGTVTVLGIGPAPIEVVQEITGHLKLY